MNDEAEAQMAFFQEFLDKAARIMHGDDIAFTIFSDTAATSLEAKRASWEVVVERLRDPVQYSSKEACPLIKLARFGDERSDKDCLRHDPNVIEITGLEGDYDGEQMPISEAAMLLHEHGITAALYTSPSHTPEKPRWRVLSPLSQPYPPQERLRFLARLNGALGGVLAPESFRLSQSYYIGRVNGSAYDVHQVRGRYIDLLDELDQRAIYPEAASTGHTRAERLEQIRSNEPVVQRLVERGLVKRQRSDGGVDIVCPFADQHTTPGGPGDCTYWPPNTGGFLSGHFHCLHSHCAGREDAQFLAAIGLAKARGARPAEPPEDEEREPVPPELSDDALALEFTRRHGDDLRYVAAWGKWLHWDGTRWAADRTTRVFDLAREVCRDAARPVKIKGLARQIASAKTVAAVERLARSDPRHALVPEVFDADAYLLNTPGGTVDLRKGTLRPHARADLITLCTGVTPDDAAPADTWLRFLSDVTSGDGDIQDYLQRLIGYCLTGDTRDHVLAVFYGMGANGKSTLLDLLLYMLGDYARQIPAETLMEARGERHPTEIANLMGVRLALSSELEEGQHWAESRLKALTGDATLTARYMRQDFFEFTRTHKHIVAGNHRPNIRIVDEAIRRRIHLVPFPARFVGARADRDMPAKLRAEAAAVLAWAIQGCQEWQVGGLTPPPTVLAATEDYLATQDTLGAWLGERCDTSDPTAEATCGSLYTDFKGWKEDRGERPPSLQRFSGQLEQRFRKERRGGKVWFQGLKLAYQET